METLRLYKDRRHKTVDIDGDVFKIPLEYTIEEAERLIELEVEQKELEKTPVDEISKTQSLEKFWFLVFAQIEIILQHYQPEITIEEIKKKLTHKQALDILGFFDKYRKNNEKSSDTKKKIL